MLKILVSLVTWAHTLNVTYLLSLVVLVHTNHVVCLDLDFHVWFILYFPSDSHLLAGVKCPCATQSFLNDVSVAI